MSIRSSRRLPRRFNRPTGLFMRTVARKRYRSQRSQMRWRQSVRRRGRSLSRGLQGLLSEFRLWLTIIALALLVGALAVVLFSPVFNVRSIRIERQDARLDKEEMQRTLAPLFNERLLFVTKAQVQSMLQQEYPDIDHIAVRKEYPSTLIVTAFTDPLAATLTILSPPQTGSGQTVSSATSSGADVHAYITSKGYLIYSTLALAHGPLPALSITDWGVRPQNRTILLQPDTLLAIFHARDTLRESFGLPVSRVVVYLRAQEFHIQAGRFALWFDLASPLQLQLGRFREFLKSAKLDDVKEYIDLRISNRVIYK